MSERTIPIVDHRYASSVPTVPAHSLAPGALLADKLGRPLHDLRISITDRCNFRCTYCMPKEVFDAHYEFLRHADLLRFEEIERLARVFVSLGVRKLRITGGEPLLRKGVEDLVAMLAAIRTPDGEPVELTMTTNASILARKAEALARAGLHRVTVSLDAIDDAVFRRMNDMDFPVQTVLEGIAAAQAAGLRPVKVNMVVQRGVNDDQILPMIEHFRGSGVVLRFIEFMDVGNTNGWRMDQVLPSAELLARIAQRHPLHALDPTVLGETAERWLLDDGSLEIGAISSVTQAFCHDCNRARLSMEGKLYLCLFASHGHDLRALLRGDAQQGIQQASDADLQAAIAQVWSRRDDRYSELRGFDGAGLLQAVRKPEMFAIGG
ncbi:Cyclic pyranopterin monophosphate synthase [Thiomonas arsenitoxydans]|uniref:GTP 3',8-cyclase n=1 Tax=Thiomonas arsenitoxydans (strain DSM 22701 / CIP 110005 / 3As) TaxID=426114 RepID=D6CMH6_THIA3|nr:GTP 3',8-cyclase MoaA [Thiomonas arsenitoxydans]CAZ89754.1 Molybdenum cofactor biosynthesis protein A (Protein narA) [Thiomonas arsenitoxydans]CQR31551.1 Cyclic pyranopterin monophosphate synthase [Thiomonas arsenitoxydans]CQR36296.1 Cyclic pyranopterin monophosphate synthase [Thiomonas arsenitoxydans]CQR39366.1 Cyclic pyranopterin monophosphate synthase [Thiomonas arsenitoxydans]CQR39409.1 Cyclic pyranopterin monophosphate synthase [Thiomonas arsenitoxydans]